MFRPTLKIGNAQAFWGDRQDAACELLSQAPDLDYLTLDYLAEVSLSLLARQRDRDPNAGFPVDFLEAFALIIPYWQAGGRCKLITNAGALNPHACAAACAARLTAAGGPTLKFAVVTGDDVLSMLRDASTGNDSFINLDTGVSLDSVRDRLVTANAYLGAAPIVEALRRGADVVITGRVADPSLTVAPCVHHFGWRIEEYDRWAAATVAGHLIECGTQVTGGISTDWLTLPDVEQIGFPIIEMSEDGSFVVTKGQGTGGAVNRQTVSEQLVYEIGDPDCYLSPDLRVSFQHLRLEEVGPDRIRVTGAKGSPPTSTFKVSATYRDGYRAVGQLTIFGQQAVQKAERSAEVLRSRLAATGRSWTRLHSECLGTNACGGPTLDDARRDTIQEVVLRIGIEAEDRELVEFFSRQFIPLVTAGPQGTTGYAEGRPHVHPVFRYWPCLIDRSRVIADVQLLDTPAVGSSPNVAEWATCKLAVAATDNPQARTGSARKSCGTLQDVACARSGDKGRNANIGVIARDPNDYESLLRFLTSERVRNWFDRLGVARVARFELPNLFAMNFVLLGILANPLRSDAQGKSLGQALLQMPLTGFGDSS